VQKQEAWFRNIFDNVPVGIVLLNQNFRPHKFNKYFKELTGYVEGDLQLIGLEQIIHADDALYGDDYNAFMSGSSSEPVEQRLTTKCGTTIWMRVKVSPLQIDNSSSTIVMFNDITSEKEAEFKLKEQAQQLKAHNEALEEFSYVISHDLQEPLRMVTSFSQIIQKKYISKIDDERANHDFNYVIDGAKRMSYLIRDMLEYSRWSAKDLPVEQVNTEKVLEETLKNLTIALELSHAEIIIHHAPIINANKVVLGQIFQNLIGNAIRYAHPDRSPIIEITIEKTANEVLFAIKDNGIGFEDKYKERIFGIFQRLHPDKSSGTGMGLAICKRVIERQGGHIWATSELNVGTTFFFTLPFVEAKNTEGVVATHPLEAVYKKTAA
jgi:PAS domain S-box-containing protein